MAAGGLNTYVPMEIKRRMRTRFTWIAAIIVLVAIGFLIACSTKYSSSSNGLVVVPTQGTTEIPGATAVMETFTLNLANGADFADQQCEWSSDAGIADGRYP